MSRLSERELDRLAEIRERDRMRVPVPSGLSPATAELEQTRDDRRYLLDVVEGYELQQELHRFDRISEIEQEVRGLRQREVQLQREAEELRAMNRSLFDALNGAQLPENAIPIGNNSYFVPDGRGEGYVYQPSALFMKLQAYVKRDD